MINIFQWDRIYPNDVNQIPPLQYREKILYENIQIKSTSVAVDDNIIYKLETSSRMYSGGASMECFFTDNILLLTITNQSIFIFCCTNGGSRLAFLLHIAYDNIGEIYSNNSSIVLEPKQSFSKGNIIIVFGSLAEKNNVELKIREGMHALNYQS